MSFNKREANKDKEKEEEDTQKQHTEDTQHLVYMQIIRDQTSVNVNELQRNIGIEEEDENEEDEKEATDDWPVILDAYIRLGKPIPQPRPHKKKDKDGEGYLLSFNGIEEARSFFNDMAQKNLTFMSSEVAGGKLTGQFFMALGDGKLIEGQVHPHQIEAVSDCFSAVKNAKDETSRQQAMTELNALISGNNPTNRWRNQMQDIRQGAQDQPAASTTPSPFKKEPKPDGVY